MVGDLRVSEVIKLRKGYFFGFGKFLLTLFNIANFILFYLIAIFNVRNGVVHIALMIASAVISGLLLLCFLLKKRWPQVVMNGIVLSFAIVFGRCSVNLHNMLETIPESGGAGPVNFSLKMILSVVILAVLFAFGAVNMVFGFIGLNKGPKMNGSDIKLAIEEKEAALKAENGNTGDLHKKLKKLLKHHDFVDYIHELDRKAIVDDPGYNEHYFIQGESKFSGNVFSLFFHRLWWGFLNTITLSILLPWTETKKYKWYAVRSTYSGKKIRFDGKGIQLLGKWVLWLLLSIITLGIYGFFAANALRKWVVSHQHFEGEEGESVYSGTTFGRGFLGLGLLLLQVITLGIATPFAKNTIMKYDMNHTKIDGHQLSFSGTGGKLFGKFVLWYFLSVITLGIYAIFVLPLNLDKYKVANTRVLDPDYVVELDPQ